MKTIQLREFVKTGQFGTISIGSTKADLVNSPGEEFDFVDCGETQLIKYGWYEFFYWTESELIFGIQNDHLQADCVNHKEMLNDIKRILRENGSVFIEEVLVYKPVKKDRVCNYPFLTEVTFKKILADNNFVIKKEYITLDTGNNKYSKIFECTSGR